MTLSRILMQAVSLCICCTLLCGCVDGPKTGQSITGCPDGTVERLQLTDEKIEHQEGKFLELVDRKDQQLILVDFWASWCGPCKMLAPELERVKKKWGDKIEVVKVNVDENHPISSFLDVQAIPDVRLFRAGRQVGDFVGLMPAEEIEALLKSLQ